MKNCSEIRGLLGEYLDGEITNPGEVQEHLENCAGCRQELERLKGLEKTLKDSFLKWGVSPSFNQSLRNKLHKPVAFGFGNFATRFVYALAVVLVFLGIVFFFITPFNDNFKKQPAAYFTYHDHHEAERIFIPSGELTDEEILMALFSDN